MTRWRVLVLIALSPFPAMAEDRPMTGAEFEAFVEGRTMDTYNDAGLLGVETFLPGRRTLWRDESHCLKGTWTVQEEMICYTYEGEEGRFCSSFHDRGDWLIGFREGVWGEDPIMLQPSTDVVTCDEIPSS
jgi:hypothetical protein